MTRSCLMDCSVFLNPVNDSLPGVVSRSETWVGQRYHRNRFHQGQQNFKIYRGRSFKNAYCRRGQKYIFKENWLKNKSKFGIVQPKVKSVHCFCRHTGFERILICRMPWASVESGIQPLSSPPVKHDDRGKHMPLCIMNHEQHPHNQGHWFPTTSS